MRDMLADSLGNNEGILLGHDIDALRAGDDWQLYWQQLSDQFSLWFGSRLDVEPRVMFLPQAGTRTTGRVWNSGG